MINDISGKLAIDANGLSSLKQVAKDQSPESIKAVAKQFEAVFVNMMLKSMRDATPQDGMFDNEQTKAFTSMLDQQLSQNIASKGVGLAEIMARQLSKATGAVNTPEMPGIDSGADAGAMNLFPAAATAKSSAARTADSSALSGDALSFQQAVSAHAEEASRASGIPANFMIGQAALESGWGKREIKGLDGTPSNNLFGIKANSSWKGKTVEAVTTEYINGMPQKRIEKFRAYDSYAESFKDFAQMMRSNPRYENVMANLNDVRGYAQAIQSAGYATDPNYASKLINVVQKVDVS